MLFFDTVNSFHRSEALKAAIELDLFTSVASTNGTASEIAARSQASERGVRILCDYLTMIGFPGQTGKHLQSDSGYRCVLGPALACLSGQRD